MKLVVYKVKQLLPLGAFPLTQVLLTPLGYITRIRKSLKGIPESNLPYNI